MTTNKFNSFSYDFNWEVTQVTRNSSDFNFDSMNVCVCSKWESEIVSSLEFLESSNVTFYERHYSLYYIVDRVTVTVTHA